MPSGAKEGLLTVTKMPPSLGPAEVALLVVTEHLRQESNPGVSLGNPGKCCHGM